MKFKYTIEECGLFMNLHLSLWFQGFFFVFSNVSVVFLLLIYYSFLLMKITYL